MAILSPALRAANAADFAGRWEWTEFNQNLQTVPIRVDVAAAGGVINATYNNPFGVQIVTAALVGEGLRFQVTEWGESRTITIYLSGRVENQAPPPALYPSVYTATLNGQPVNYTGPVVGSATVRAEDFVGRWQWTRNGSIAVYADVYVILGNVSVAYHQSDSTQLCSPVVLNDGLIFGASEDAQNHTLVIHYDTRSVDDWPGGTVGGGTPAFYQATWSPLPPFPPPGGGSTGITQQLHVAVSAPSYTPLKNMPGNAVDLSFGTTGMDNQNLADLGQPLQFKALVIVNGKASQSYTYQWGRDGAAIPGATSSEFIVQQAGPETNGRYTCTATDGQSTATWATQVEVRNPPVIVSQSDDIADVVGKPLHLSVRATCARAPLRFQWFRNGSEIPGTTSGNLKTSTGPVDSTSSYDVAIGTTADLGTYMCAVTCYGGTTTATFQVGVGPKIIVQPQSQTMFEGGYLQLSAEAQLVGGWVSCQWLHDGVAIPGATSGSLGLKSDGSPDPRYAVGFLGIRPFYSTTVQPADAGTYTCRITTAAGTVETESVRVDVKRLAHLVNLSARVPAGGAAGTPFCGFVLGGTQPLPVLVRAVGPTLGEFGLAGIMPQPTIHLHNPDGSIPVYRGWPADRSTDMTAIGAFPLQGSRDAATFLTLALGLYTAEVSDADPGNGGIVLLEVYDNSRASPSNGSLINASTRGFVGTGDNAMFAGFVVEGANSVKLLIRAVGPGLTQFGIGDAISDLKIEVFQGTTKLAENDNWTSRTDGWSREVFETAALKVDAFPLEAGSKDAVILRDFTAGTYSAQITGVNGATGTAIVEVYVVK